MPTPDCYRCCYRRDLPHDTHSQCFHPSIGRHRERAVLGLVPDLIEVTAQAHGVGKGWFVWPLNFDPVWLTSCTGFLPAATRAPTP